ncbi:UxaA family hydrolase [Methanospirillum sp.]
MSFLPVVKCLILHREDNVGTLATSEGKANQIVEESEFLKYKITLKSDVPKGHKIAIRLIDYNEPVKKYGQIIGISTKRILPGEHVHVHNIQFSDKIQFSEQYLYEPTIDLIQNGLELPSTFKGYIRSDGRAGIRNYVVVVSTVNCSASVVKEITNFFQYKELSKYGIDGIVPVVHTSGCAQSIGGHTNRILNRTLIGWLTNPNVVGCLIIGLGCEVVTPKSLIDSLRLKEVYGGTSVESFNIQEVGGFRKAVKLGIERLEHIFSSLPEFKRINLPVSKLTVALNCGGSDAFSGITANPALGVAGDILVSLGGKIVLGEVPECYGGKNYLMQRCLNQKESEKINQVFSWWDIYAKKNSVNMNDNISLGNISGGISTILEKSLGAISKGGSSPINQVVDYSEKITEDGLVFMNTPGFDPVSVTGLVAGGCNLVAFTTGRGSVYGCSIAPTIKIASNTELFESMIEDMDVNAGKILTTCSLDEVGREIYNLIIQVANGTKTCSETHGLGKEEFAPWQVGEVL